MGRSAVKGWLICERKISFTKDLYGPFAIMRAALFIGRFSLKNPPVSYKGGLQHDISDTLLKDWLAIYPDGEWVTHKFWLL